MIKICIFGLIFSPLVFAETSIYENEAGQVTPKIYESSIQEVVNPDYLNQIQPEEKEILIESSSYGRKDSTGNLLTFNLNNPETISYADKTELILKFSSFSHFNTGLTFYGFTHDYSTEFKKMFYDAKKANSMIGSLIFSLDQKIIGNKIGLHYLTGAGVSFFKGSGYFSDDGSEADMRITLWILPFDIGLAGVYEFNNKFRLLLGGGISGVGIIQSRSDLDVDNSDKTIFQFGYGPFITTKLNIGLSSLLQNFSLGMFRDYGITNTFLNLEYRFQNYSNFKENFAIKGSALGAGISFNFM